MQNLLSFFVTDSFPMTALVLALAVLLMFLILTVYTPTITRYVFPRFGYRKYSELLPFKSVLNDNMTVRLNNGALVRVYRMAGVQTSMQDDATKNQFLDLRAQLFNQINDPAAVLRFFTVRDAAETRTDYEFDQPVLQKIHDRWESQGLRIFRNSYYLVLSVGGAGANDKMAQYSNYVESILAAYRPTVLLHNQPRNAAAFFGRILSPVTKPEIARADESMSSFVTVDSVAFGRGGIVRYQSGADQKFAAIMSFKTSPDFLDEEFFDGISAIQTEVITMNAFKILGASGVESVIRQKKSTIGDQGAEIAEQQIESAVAAMDENISGNQGMVNYYPMFVVFGDTVADLEKYVDDFKRISAGFGIAPVVENFAAKVSWFAMLPGYDAFPRSFKLLSRTAAVSIPMSSVPVGVPNSDWGPGPIVVFPTAQGTPYQFQFHVSEAAGATAHTLTIGPTGGGKTTLFSFLIAQSLRHQRLRAFFFDRNRGAEIFTISTGGKYLTFNAKDDGDKAEFAGAMDFETRLNPLKMEDSPNNRAFLRRWLMMISGQSDPKSLDEIARAVSVNFDYVDIKDRELKNLWTASFSSGGPMRAALKKWVDPLQYGGVFNERKDTLDLYSRLTTFDFTDVLNDETLAPAVISYIIHRINNITVANGNPSLIMIDETAPMLANPMFRENFITGLQEGRKNRQAYMAAFQRANIIDKLGIGDVVRGQAQTVIFFRNPGADANDYEHWKLNPLEMAFIQGKAYPNLKRAVLLSRPVTGESVVLNTELGGLGPLMKLFESGRSAVLLAEELYKNFGDKFVEEYLKRMTV
ncbi:MAG: hypothetical protein FWC61_00095 [Proteobacteria bacterium]|nr:hypothetical protein [Pseudomonadota bacterium]